MYWKLQEEEVIFLIKFLSLEIFCKKKLKSILTLVVVWDLCLLLTIKINFASKPQMFRILLILSNNLNNLVLFSIWMWKKKNQHLLLWIYLIWTTVLLSILIAKSILLCFSVFVAQLYLSPTTIKPPKILYRVLCLNKLWEWMLWTLR